MPLFSSILVSLHDKLCLIIALLTAGIGCAQADSVAQQGNFILPSSQQPGPLIGFGQTIVDRNETQLVVYTNPFFGANTHFINVAPAIIYGLTDRLTLLLNMPIAASFKDGQHYSSGLEDASFQLEYAFYANQTDDFNDQATVLSAATIPTGSSTDEPPTGFGSPSFFIGSTFDHTAVDWFAFAAPGAILTTSNNNTRFGDQFLYQAGLGRNIMDVGTQWIIAWMVEADGQYSQKDIRNGITDPNSGGNVVYITPSLWFSSKELIIQPGIGFPVVQHLFGEQNKNSYLLALYLSWSFY
jgi:hypothetical protein